MAEDEVCERAPATWAESIRKTICARDGGRMLERIDAQVFSSARCSDCGAPLFPRGTTCVHACQKRSLDPVRLSEPGLST